MQTAFYGRISNIQAGTAGILLSLLFIHHQPTIIYYISKVNRLT